MQYFIDTRLLAIQSSIEINDLDNYLYNRILYRCIKRMRNMNHLFNKSQKETHQLLNELETKLNN